jgi:hypothetical protein
VTRNNRISILWGDRGRPKGPRTTPLHSRPYGTFTRKDGEPNNKGILESE